MNKFINKSNLKFLFFIFISAAAMPLFAQGDLGSLGLGGLENFGKTVQSIFTGTITKIILTCCLAGCGIAYGFNKDNEKMKRNVIAIGIAIAIIAAASFIVGAIFDASKN